MRPPLPLLATGGLLAATFLSPCLAQQAQVLIPEPRVHVVTAGPGVEHQLFVSLPLGYDADPEARFRVLYILDGNTMFAMLAQTYGYMEAFEALGPIILVGLGYTVDTWEEVLIRRAYDYTPTRYHRAERWWKDRLGRDDVLTGGGDRFLSFLQTDVIPLIDATYRTNDTRVLAGFSYGGLFAAHALFTAPEMFAGYVIGSPSLGWDDGVIFDLEARFAERSRSLPARVFLSAGELERTTFEGVKRLTEVLAERDYQDLQITHHVFYGETHLSVIPATLSRGLTTLFADNAP